MPSLPIVPALDLSGDLARQDARTTELLYRTKQLAQAYFDLVRKIEKEREMLRKVAE